MLELVTHPNSLFILCVIAASTAGTDYSLAGAMLLVPLLSYASFLIDSPLMEIGLFIFVVFILVAQSVAITVECKEEDR